MDQDQVERLTINYQRLQDQLQSLNMQKEQMQSQKEEYKIAEEELSKASGRVYVSVGGAIIESTKEEAIKNVKDKQEFIAMRLTIIEKQIEESSRREAEMKKQINDILKANKPQ
ncbi:MAG: prefoldin subunit [Candidatus Marsarchaeota archaeon]|jgi:prefoldin beta subunit|nr:prefoldin subunit [Candidatus Marsarchaeota archaeon]MCL5434658.1 prefoldin subunit [Candidatus Marsarchaeota archaeon]